MTCHNPIREKLTWHTCHLQCSYSSSSDPLLLRRSVAAMLLCCDNGLLLVSAAATMQPLRQDDMQVLHRHRPRMSRTSVVLLFATVDISRPYLVRGVLLGACLRPDVQLSWSLDAACLYPRLSLSCSLGALLRLRPFRTNCT